MPKRQIFDELEKASPIHKLSLIERHHMIIAPTPVEFLHSAITLPEFNTFAIQFGDFGIRWYALAYIAGLLIGIYVLRREAQLPGALMTPDQTDRLLNYLLIGIIFGGGLATFFFTTPIFI